jgi:hypothetical protein
MTRQPSIMRPGVGGCSLHQLRLVEDLRGKLSVGESQRDIPSVPKRHFLIFDVPAEEARGRHAHRLASSF